MKDLINKISNIVFLENMDAFFFKKRKTLISFANNSSSLSLMKNKDVLNMIDYLFVDGGFLVNLLKLIGIKVKRQSFDYTSLAKPFFEYVASNQKKLAIIGATDEEIFKVRNHIIASYPSIQLVFFHNGYYNNQESIDETINQLIDYNVDVLVCGMGVIHQEKTSRLLLDNVPSLTLSITCGGFFTQTARKDDYYHPLIKKLNLRWFQRAIEYKHVRKRLFVDYPVFIALFLVYFIRNLGFRR